MTSSYRKTVEKLAEQNASLLPCRRCEQPTQRSILAQRGAMCLACYHRYCCTPHAQRTAA